MRMCVWQTIGIEDESVLQEFTKMADLWRTLHPGVRFAELKV